MCGIIGYIGKKEVIPVLLEGLKKLEYRGYDSAGIAVVDHNHVWRKRVKGKITALEEKLSKKKLPGDYGIGHTRWATHGRPSEENAHPHQDCQGKVVVVHNGIIENYLELKSSLKAEGHVFKTETDTEVIAHLLEKFFHNSLEEALKNTVRILEGAFVIAAISAKDPGKIVLARKGPPAVVGLGEEEYFISSDINPLLSHTQDVIFLDDHEIAVIQPDCVKFCDFAGKMLEKPVEHISWSPLMIEKGGYKHFMLKEIFEQPQVIRETLQGRISLDTGKVFLDEIKLRKESIGKIDRVVIMACGTSYHAGLLGKHFIEALSRIPVEVEYASEYRYRNFVLTENTLMVAISQSGETADTLAALRKIKAFHPVILAICNVDGSSLTREVDGVLMTHAGPEIGVAATKTFLAQVTALALLALFLGQRRGYITQTASQEYIQELQRVPVKIEKTLSRSKDIKRLALSLASYNHFLYLGRGLNYPIALEGALKLKEISYIHAEGYPGGEMKHGPIALIDEKMPVLAIAPKDLVYEKILNNISEIKARMGYVVAVAFENDENIHDKVDEVISIPLIHPLFSPYVTAVPLQLLAYYIAAVRGVDIDQPRNLAKSVTVE